MKFFLDCTVLTTHTQNAPLVTTFNIDTGLITHVGVFYPSGCHGRVYAKVFFQAHQILPRNQESWCHGNNGWFEEDASFTVDASPLKIKIVAWAEDTDFNHTITVCVEVTPFPLVPVWDKVDYMINCLAELLDFPQFTAQPVKEEVAV